jgi:hypothetical protein
MFSSGAAGGKENPGPLKERIMDIEAKNRFFKENAAERTLALAEKAQALSPNHAGWYWHGVFYDHMSSCEYGDALRAAQKVDQPAWYADPLYLAIAYGAVGRIEDAQAAAELRRLRPVFIIETARFGFEGGFMGPDLVETLPTNPRKTGLPEVSKDD